MKEVHGLSVVKAVEKWVLGDAKAPPSILVSTSMLMLQLETFLNNHAHPHCIGTCAHMKGSEREHMAQILNHQ